MLKSHLNLMLITISIISSLLICSIWWLHWIECTTQCYQWQLDNLMVWIIYIDWIHRHTTSVKTSRVGQICSLWQILQISKLASLKSHVFRQSLLRKSASVFSSEASHIGERVGRLLWIVWCYNSKHSLHRVGERVPPIFLMKVIAVI